MLRRAWVPRRKVAVNASSEHKDAAPYIEQSGYHEELDQKLHFDTHKQPPTAAWTCPVCGGSPQTDTVEPIVIVGVEAVEGSWIALQCHCGHLHAEGKQGCGYGIEVQLPDDVAGALDQENRE